MQAKAALPSCRARAPPMRLQCLHTGNHVRQRPLVHPKQESSQLAAKA